MGFGCRGKGFFAKVSDYLYTRNIAGQALGKFKKEYLPKFDADGKDKINGLKQNEKGEVWKP